MYSMIYDLKIPTSRLRLTSLDERHNFDCVWYDIWVHQVRCKKQARQRGVLKVIIPTPNTINPCSRHRVFKPACPLKWSSLVLKFCFFKSPDWLKTWCKDGWQHGRPPTKSFDKMQAAAEEGVAILSHKCQLTKKFKWHNLSHYFNVAEYQSRSSEENAVKLTLWYAGGFYH